MNRMLIVDKYVSSDVMQYITHVTFRYLSPLHLIFSFLLFGEHTTAEAGDEENPRLGGLTTTTGMARSKAAAKTARILAKR